MWLWTVNDCESLGLVMRIYKNIPTENNRGVPVNIQDQTSKPVVLNFNKVSNSTALSVLAVKGAKSITVDSTTGFAAGKYVIIFDPLSLNFSFYKQVGDVAGNVITLDTPLDYAYPIGAYVDVGSVGLNVDGSSTAQVFGLRGTGEPPGVELTIDVTEIIFSCVTDSACSLPLFADLSALTNGIVIRKRNDDVTNIMNIKTNSGFQLRMFEFNIEQATNPAQGRDGFSARRKFAGQDNVGVAIRLPVGEDLEILVQDNLTGITTLEAVAIGHVVQN
jgi:hypothetical protein